MAKVMLVEDDNNLREIYEARLAAEGYDIVSAQDGEEALALAVKEKPDLIIADIMMPRVSGFDMLDILRSTPETKNTKIIMMTALSQAEDKARAEKLGADRYLVKSQVTLEDVVKVAAEMLQDKTSKSDEANIAATGAVVSQPDATPVSTPQPPGEPADDSQTKADDPKPEDPPEDDPPAVTPPPAEPPTDPAPTVTGPPAIADDTSGEDSPPDKPTNGSKDDKSTNSPSKLSNTTAEEEAEISQQIEDFISKNPTLSTSAEPPKPTTPQETKPDKPSETEKPKPTTSIPVTVASEPDKTESDADKTLQDAVDSLGPKPSDSPVSEQAEESSEPAQVTGKKGGERVIQPLSDPRVAGPDLDTLLAQEKDTETSALPPAAVITPDGTTLTPPAGSTSVDTTPGQVIASSSPSTPANSNISL